MRLKQVNTIAQVKSISVNTSRFLMVKNDSSVWKDEVVIFNGGRYCFANNINDHYYNFGDRNEKFLFRDNEQIQLDNYDSNTLSDKGAVIAKNQRVTEAVVQDYYYRNFESNAEVLLLENAIGGFVINFDNDQRSIFRSFNLLKSVSLETGTINWGLDLNGYSKIINNEESPAQIISIIGIFEKQLLVWMEGDRLISVNTENGTLNYELLPFEGLLNANGFQVWNFQDLCLEEKKGIITVFNKHFYYQIDLHTRAVRLVKNFYTGNSSELGREPGMPEPPTDLVIRKSVYTDDYIYFMGGYLFTSNVIGVFNRTTLEIEYQETLDLGQTDKNNNLRDIQFAGNTLYVLDTEGTLRIFEQN